MANKTDKISPNTRAIKRKIQGKYMIKGSNNERIFSKSFRWSVCCSDYMSEGLRESTSDFLSVVMQKIPQIVAHTERIQSLTRMGIGCLFVSIPQKAARKISSTGFPFAEIVLL